MGKAGRVRRSWRRSSACLFFFNIIRCESARNRAFKTCASFAKLHMRSRVCFAGIRVPRTFRDYFVLKSLRFLYLTLLGWHGNEYLEEETANITYCVWKWEKGLHPFEHGPPGPIKMQQSEIKVEPDVINTILRACFVRLSEDAIKAFPTLQKAKYTVC